MHTCSIRVDAVNLEEGTYAADVSTTRGFQQCGVPVVLGVIHRNTGRAKEAA